jgi:predicted HTH domain antitoxin
MMTLTLETPTGEKDAALNLRLPEDPAVWERLAVMLYDMRAVSQGKAAQIAGLTRAGFIDALGRHGVTPFQYEDEDDLRADVERAML